MGCWCRVILIKISPLLWAPIIIITIIIILRRTIRICTNIFFSTTHTHTLRCSSIFLLVSYFFFASTWFMRKLDLKCLQIIFMKNCVLQQRQHHTIRIWTNTRIQLTNIGQCLSQNINPVYKSYPECKCATSHTELKSAWAAKSEWLSISAA